MHQAFLTPGIRVSAIHNGGRGFHEASFMPAIINGTLQTPHVHEKEISHNG